jgi:cysteine desulfurase/selenocysteine lyase
VMADSLGIVDPAAIRQACQPGTRLLIMNHCSNVTGTLQEIGEIGPWCRQHGILFMVDAAQSAGIIPINVKEQAIDLLAVPGHKSLFGPTGTGFLYVRKGLELRPLLYGGTGNFSKSEQQPVEMPERLESGTLNTAGLAGLKAGLDFLETVKLDHVRHHEHRLLTRLLDGLTSLAGVTLYGPVGSDRHIGALSFNVKNLDPAMLGFRLDREYGICCRIGLHCAPQAHGSIGTLPEGTVRLSPGYFNSADDVEQTLTAIREIVAAES